MIECLLVSMLAMFGADCENSPWSDSSTYTQMAKHDPRLAEVLERSTYGWFESPDYNKLALQLGGAKSLDSGVFLEIGDQASSAYRFVLLEVAGDERLLTTNISGVFRQTRVQAEEWSSLLVLLDRESAWSLGSDGDLRVNDGSAYFITACIDGRSAQFAIYAPVLESAARSQDRKSFRDRTRSHTEVITTILRLARSKVGNLTPE